MSKAKEPKLTNEQVSRMIDGAYFDDRFDLDEDGKVPEWFEQYDAKITADQIYDAKIWARSEEEAMEIADGMTPEEVKAYISCNHRYEEEQA